MGGGRHNDAAADALLLASTCESSRSGDSHHMYIQYTCRKHDAGINYYVSSRVVASYGLATGHWLTTIMFPGWLLLTIIIFLGWLAIANTNEEYWGEAR